MKRVLLVVVVIVVAGLGSYVMTRQLQPPGPAPETFDELAWLQREFDLSPAELERIAALEAAYRPICDAHCARIMDLQHEVATARAAGTPPPTDALAAAARTCMEASRAHLRQVAAVMPPAQGRRYLALIEPKLVQHDHAQPFGLQ